MDDMNTGSVPAPVVLHDDDPGARRYAAWLAEEFDSRATHHDSVDPGELVVAGTVVLVTGMRPGGRSRRLRFHQGQLGGAGGGRSPCRRRHGRSHASDR